MIVAQDMERPMHRQPRNLLADTDAVLARPFSRHLGRDIDVPNDRHPRVGAGESECDHVGGALAAEMLSVQRGHRAAREKGDRDQRVADALGAEHGADDSRKTLPAQGRAYSVRRHIDDERHGVENSAVTPPPAAG
jgi:hypothetical protein